MKARDTLRVRNFFLIYIKVDLEPQRKIEGNPRELSVCGLYWKVFCFLQTLLIAITVVYEASIWMILVAHPLMKIMNLMMKIMPKWSYHRDDEDYESDDMVLEGLRPHPNFRRMYSFSSYQQSHTSANGVYGKAFVFIGGNLVSWSSKKQPTDALRFCLFLLPSFL
ncbi:hypothetical protein MKW98_030673 [Papaver atlanticum]|uniref:Uncharacterized protein n=1 Tax=Papaver atlanticum TaxID=357466 RepID=A0AAD4X2K4_9MAGN|nr:hypothetical protein MKW98_030673 [Papaver atlanticum]